jgi:hypothetical protein
MYTNAKFYARRTLIEKKHILTKNKKLKAREHSQHCQMVIMAGSMSSTQMVANKEFRSAMLVPNISYIGIHQMVHKNKAVVMGKKTKA